MMQLLTPRRFVVLPVMLWATLLSPRTGQAAAECAALTFPVLWGKSWWIGYGLLFLGILLGLLALLIPSMRRVLRKKDV